MMAPPRCVKRLQMTGLLSETGNRNANTKEAEVKNK